MLAGCKHKTTDVAGVTSSIDYTKVAVPAFSADSAYAAVQAQLSFGNRIPGSKGWERCADWLASQLQRHCDTVIVQTFRATLWNGATVPGRNIIGSLNPQADKRVLLAAHWDSRSWADHDNDEDLHHSPVPGANDGASGSAVVLEMARIMRQLPPSVGVDFVLFDVEDQGIPEWSDLYEEDSWCLGSQYWAKNPHVPYYKAVYGVLFDMVGTSEPRFTKEHVSRSFAPSITDKIWSAAAALGYSNIFDNTKTDAILDDHYYVNQIAGIPMVDIVQNSPNISFFAHWHTTTDDLSTVSAETMRIVATVVLKTIYGDYPNE